MQPRFRGPSSGRAAFTLIELLTVIAIIALLAAIIFPVFATARESARRGACISNMRQIQSAVKQYQLDNRRYPEFLFGPAVNQQGTVAAPGDTALPVREVLGLINSTDANNQVASRVKRLYATGLFPEYVRSVDVFRCPNNDVNTTDGNAKEEVVRYEYNQETERAEPRTFTFYKYDSYDANPRIDANLRLTPNTFAARYSRIWTPIYDGPNDPQMPNELRPVYNRQLYWQTPPDDTYLTMCTYHVPKDKIVVMWLNGQAKVLDVRKLKKDMTPPLQVNNQLADYEMYRFGPND
jgi:prepilin-type N-terminal cleavage/methylation domain-containing protein